MSKRSHKQTLVDGGTAGAQFVEPNKEADGNHATERISASPETEPGKHPYLEAMVAGTSDAMIALDEHFHILDFNPALRTALNWSPEKTIGRNCSEFLRCCNLNRIELCGTSSCPLVRVLEQKQPLPNEEMIIGGTCEVSASVIPVDAGNGQLHVVFTARDVSALKVANRVRANFVSMVSHELRTPLNSIHGFIDLLLQGHMGDLNSEQKKYLGYAQEGVQQLISIVEDILLLTRSDSGQFELKQQEVDFHELAKLVVTSLQPQALKAEVTLNQDIPDPPPVLYADPQRMKQVLNNLVTNAIKYTPPGGTITISSRRYDDRFELISIADTGYGIPVEDRQHIFERFYQ